MPTTKLILQSNAVSNRKMTKKPGCRQSDPLNNVVILKYVDGYKSGGNQYSNEQLKSFQQ